MGSDNVVGVSGWAGADTRTRRRALLGLAAIVVVALVAGAYLAVRGGSSGGALEPEIAAVIDLRPVLSGIAVGDGSVWVSGSSGTGAETGAGRIWRIDPRTNRASAPSLHGGGGGIAVAAGSVWTVDASGAVVRTDERTGRLQATIRTSGLGETIVAGAGALWAGRNRIDPATNRARIVVERPGSLIAIAGPEGVWTEGDVVQRIDRSGRVLATVPRPGFRPDAMAAGAGSVWVAYASRSEFELTSVVRIDARTNEATASAIDLRGHLPAAIAVAAGRVWLLTRREEEEGARLWQIDPEGNRIVGKSLHLPHGSPFLLAAGGDTLWIAEDLDEGTVTRVDLK